MAGTNLYVMVVAPTGEGKEAGHDGIDALIRAVIDGVQDTQLPDMPSATHIGLDTPARVYIDWQSEPNRHERTVAEHLVVARKIIHIEPGGNKPWME